MKKLLVIAIFGILMPTFSTIIYVLFSIVKILPLISLAFLGDLFSNSGDLLAGIIIAATVSGLIFGVIPSTIIGMVVSHRMRGLVWTILTGALSYALLSALIGALTDGRFTLFIDSARHQEEFAAYWNGLTGWGRATKFLKEMCLFAISGGCSAALCWLLTQRSGEPSLYNKQALETDAGAARAAGVVKPKR